MAIGVWLKFNKGNYIHMKQIRCQHHVDTTSDLPMVETTSHLLESMFKKVLYSPELSSERGSRKLKHRVSTSRLIMRSTVTHVEEQDYQYLK